MDDLPEWIAAGAALGLAFGLIWPSGQRPQKSDPNDGGVTTVDGAGSGRNDPSPDHDKTGADGDGGGDGGGGDGGGGGGGGGGGD